VLTVTKKDPSGWWEAEFKGKSGVIPHTYVADYWEARALRLPTSSPEDFVKSLRDQLAITTSMSVTFLDPDLDTYVILENIRDLPVEKAKVKVATQAMSWWG